MRKFLFLFLSLCILSCTPKKQEKGFKKGFNLINDIHNEDVEKDLNKVVNLLNELLNTKDTDIFHNSWNNDSSFLEYSWGNFYNILDNIPENYQPILLMFQKLNKDKYLLKMAVVGEYQGAYNIQSIYNFFAIRNGNTFKFSDLLSHNLKNWKRYSYDNIDYYFKTEPNHFLQEQKQQEQFEDKIIQLFNVEKLYYKYIICKDNKMIYQICGFDYEPSMNGVKYGGMSLPSEKVIFSGNNSAFYPHELVHLYTKEYFPNIHNIIDEGMATYLGGSLGLSYLEQKQELKNAYNRHKERIFFDDLMNKENRYARISEYSSLLYAGGALICDFTHHKLGTKGLKTLMSSGKTDEELIKTLEKLFNTDREKINELLVDYLNK